MRPSFFSIVSAATPFATTAVSAAPVDYDRDLRRLPLYELARYEAGSGARSLERPEPPRPRSRSAL
jgi:hypothetical protein